MVTLMDIKNSLKIEKNNLSLNPFRDQKVIVGLKLSTLL